MICSVLPVYKMFTVYFRTILSKVKPVSSYLARTKYL